MKRIFIFAFVMSVCVALPAYADSQFYNPIGKGCTNAFYIDKDCDGYGVASPLGVDADDNDPEVNTPETVIAKYGTLENFLHHLGYYPDRIFYISANGDDSTGEVDNSNKPYKTWDAVKPLLEPGDAVIFRGGVYIREESISKWGFPDKLSGEENAPIIFMVYPGEKVIIDGKISFRESGWLIFDGFIIDNFVDQLGDGVKGSLSHNILIRNIESKGHASGCHIMYDLHNILIENCVFHDNPNSHGIYLGSLEDPNTNLTVRNCIMYRNGRHGFQHNGRVENLVVENCIMHSNILGGISLLQGVRKSVFRNNLIFNNNKQGIIFYLYPSENYCFPYDQFNNFFINNLIWIGKYRWKGDGIEPSDHAPVQFNDATGNHSMDGNIFRNNILVAYNGPVFRFDQKKFADTATIENNVIYRVGGSDEVMTYGEEDVYDFNAFQNFTKLIKNNVFQDPKFTNVSIDYNLNPEKFNFDYLSNSSVRDFGSPVDAPSTDLRGNPRDENSDAGCYEYGWISTNKPPIANAGEDIIVVDSDDDWKENITLNASQSYDQDGQIIHYLWYERGEQLGNQKVITLPFSVGTHQVKLMTVDDKGALSYDMISVEVKPGPNVIFLQNGWNNYTRTHICRISSQYPTYNYHNVDWAGDIGGGDSNIQRLIVRFDDLENMLSSVPEDNEIVKAELRLYQIQRTDNIMGQSIKVFPLKKTFDPDTVCWNNSSSDDPWAVPGAYDENDVDMNPIAAVMMDEQNNIWREWNITNYVKALRNGTKQNYGLLLKQDNETADSSSSYKMPTDDEEALRPELVIHFQSLIQ